MAKSIDGVIASLSLVPFKKFKAAEIWRRELVAGELPGKPTGFRHIAENTPIETHYITWVSREALCMILVSVHWKTVSLTRYNNLARFKADVREIYHLSIRFEEEKLYPGPSRMILPPNKCGRNLDGSAWAMENIEGWQYASFQEFFDSLKSN